MNTKTPLTDPATWGIDGTEGDAQITGIPAVDPKPTPNRMKTQKAAAAPPIAATLPLNIETPPWDTRLLGVAPTPEPTPKPAGAVTADPPSESAVFKALAADVKHRTSNLAWMVVAVVVFSVAVLAYYEYLPWAVSGAVWICVAVAGYTVKNAVASVMNTALAAQTWIKTGVVMGMIAAIVATGGEAKWVCLSGAVSYALLWLLVLDTGLKRGQMEVFEVRGR